MQDLFHTKELKAFVDKALPKLVGTEAIRFFQKSFQNQGFTDKALKPWPEVERRKATVTRKGKEVANPAKGAARKRAILHGASTGGLKDSLAYEVVGTEIHITSDLDYAVAHNQGTKTAGRNRNVVIPQRQFAGESEELDNILAKEIGKDLERIFKGD